MNKFKEAKVRWHAYYYLSQTLIRLSGTVYMNWQSPTTVLPHAEYQRVL